MEERVGEGGVVGWKDLIMSFVFRNTVGGAAQTSFDTKSANKTITKPPVRFLRLTEVTAHESPTLDYE
jgi:hypothetical protein